MMNKTLIVACFAALMPLVYGDQGGFLNSGCSLAGGSPVTFRPVAYGTFAGTLALAESNGAVDTVAVRGVSTVNN